MVGVGVCGWVAFGGVGGGFVWGVNCGAWRSCWGGVRAVVEERSGERERGVPNTQTTTTTNKASRRPLQQRARAPSRPRPRTCDGDDEPDLDEHKDEAPVKQALGLDDVDRLRRGGGEGRRGR